jgi:hypothetical protein
MTADGSRWMHSPPLVDRLRNRLEESVRGIHQAIDMSAWNARCRPNRTLTKPSHPERNNWLIAIGVLKLLKALLFVSMGFGVIKLLHKDLGDILLHVTTALRFDPENRAVNVLLDKVAGLDTVRLKLISFALFLYAALDVVEGTG